MSHQQKLRKQSVADIICEGDRRLETARRYTNQHNPNNGRVAVTFSSTTTEPNHNKLSTIMTKHHHSESTTTATASSHYSSQPSKNTNKNNNNNHNHNHNHNGGNENPSGNNDRRGIVKSKPSIFDLDSNLAHLRDKAIEMIRHKDEVNPDTDSLGKVDELPHEIRRELRDIPEEKAHQGHRSLYRSPLGDERSGHVEAGAFPTSPTSQPTNNVNHLHLHTSASSPSPLRYTNNNVKNLFAPALDAQHRHALDRYSLAELSRGGQLRFDHETLDATNRGIVASSTTSDLRFIPVGHNATVSAFFESPNAIRETRHGERTIDQILSEDNYRLTEAVRRVHAAEKMIPEAQRQRKEINERCYADLVSAVGGILNKTKKKRILRESESKAVALLRRQKRALLGKSDNDDDTSSSEDGDFSFSKKNTKRTAAKENVGNDSDDSDDDDDDDGSSIDFSDNDDDFGKGKKKRGSRSKKITNTNGGGGGGGKRKRRKYESRLQEILDIVDSALYDDAGNPTNESKPHSGNDVFSNSVIGDDVFGGSFVCSEEDFFSDAGESDVGTELGELGDEDEGKKSSPGSARLKATTQTLRFAKKLRKQQQNAGTDGEANLLQPGGGLSQLNEEKERIERQKQLLLRARMEKDRLAQMRAQLEAKRNELRDEKKAAAKSNWFKKAIHASPNNTRLSQSRTSMHPLRSGTMSPGSIRKMMDVEFADENENDELDRYDDEAAGEGTPRRGGAYSASPTPDRPGTSAADLAAKKGRTKVGDDGIETLSSDDDGASSSAGGSEDERSRWELAEQAAVAARAILAKGATDDPLLGARRKSMLLALNEEDRREGDDRDVILEDDGYEWKLVGSHRASRSLQQQSEAMSKVAGKSLLELRQIENCPSGIFLIQERPSRHEAVAEVYIGNRSSEAQWLMLDYTKAVETMDVLPDPIVASIGDEKHLCCSAPGVKLHVATIRRVDGNAAGDMSLLKKNLLDVLPVTTEEALLVKATLTRLANDNKIASARRSSGMDDVFDEDYSNGRTLPTDATDSKDQQHMSIGSDAISRFLQKRSDDKRKEDARVSKRQQKQQGGQGGKPTFLLGAGDGNAATSDALKVNDAELQAVMNDALANSQVDANTLLAALERLRAAQDNQAKLALSNKSATDAGKKKAAGSTRSLPNNNNNNNNVQDEDENVELATKALLKSVQKIQQEKREQKIQEKLEKELLAQQEKEREKDRKATEKQLRELTAMKKKMEEDGQLTLLGPKVTDPSATAAFLNLNASLIAPGGTTKQKKERAAARKARGKKSGTGKRRSLVGAGAASSSHSINNNNNAIEELLRNSTTRQANNNDSEKNSASQHQKSLTEQELKNQALLQQLQDDAESKPLTRRNSTPFVRSLLTPEQLAEHDRERRILEDERRRAGTATGSSRSSTANLLPVPVYTEDELAAIERQKKLVAEAESLKAQSVLDHDGHDDDYYSNAPSPKDKLLKMEADDPEEVAKRERQRKMQEEIDTLTWGGTAEKKYASRGVITPSSQASSPRSNNLVLLSSSQRLREGDDMIDLERAASNLGAAITEGGSNNGNNNNNNNSNNTTNNNIKSNALELQSSSKNLTSKDDNSSNRSPFGGGRGGERSGSFLHDRLRTPESSFGQGKSGTFNKSKSNRNNQAGDAAVHSSSSPVSHHQYSGFGTAVKGGPSFGQGFSSKNNAVAASLRSSIKIKDSKQLQQQQQQQLLRQQGKAGARDNNSKDDDVFDENAVEIFPGLTNEEAKILLEAEKNLNKKSAATAGAVSPSVTAAAAAVVDASRQANPDGSPLPAEQGHEELKKSIAERILGPEGSPSAALRQQGLSLFVTDGSLKVDEIAGATATSSNSLASSPSQGRGRWTLPQRQQNPPDDFIQHPLLSDRILTEAFEKVLQVAKEAEERQAAEEEKNKGLANSVIDRDLCRSRLTVGEDGSPYRSPSATLRELMGESMFRKARNAIYVPKVRPPVESEDDVRRAYQGRVRASILNAQVFDGEDNKRDSDRESGSEGEDNDAEENLDEETRRNRREARRRTRPDTSTAIRNLIRDHVELTFNLRSELAQLARMLRSTRTESEIAALRKVILATAWQYQRGREINLQKLIVLLERKTNHRKWLPFIVNDNVYSDLGGFGDSLDIPHSGRMYGGWRLPKERIITGSMHQMMILAASNSVHEIPSIQALASFEVAGLTPGSTRMNLSPKPPPSHSLTARPPTGARCGDDAAASSSSSSFGVATLQNTARARRLAAIAAAREGKGCKFYGVLHLSAEAEERLLSTQQQPHQPQLFASSLPLVSANRTRQEPTLSVSAFKKITAR